jgi:hypothetical protein
MNAPAPVTDLATLRNPPPPPDLKVDFFSRNGFDLACRIAKAYATSDAVPAAFRSFTVKKNKDFSETIVENPAAIGNCLVAIEVSASVGLSITSVMQNADVIEGKLRWSSKFQIAAVNASRRFSPLRFALKNLGRIKATYREKQNWNKARGSYDYIDRTVEIDNWECTAWAYVLDGKGAPTKEVVQSIPVTMQMAVEEGWYSKSGSKWQGAMRFQMLQYRAGSFFASIYAPDVIMGMGRSIEDHFDAIEVVRQEDGVFAAAAPTLQELRAGADSAQDGQQQGGGDVKGDTHAQIEHQQPGMTIPQQTAAPDAVGATPDDDERAYQQVLSETLAKEERAEKESQRRRRERGGLGIE